MDLYYEIKEIKERQERMLARLDALVEENSKERVYNVDQLAALLNVSRRTIFSWKKEGKLPCTQVNGKIWVTKGQLQLFLEKNAISID